ncbi:MAG: glycogen/starch synthase, partial [Kiritimatiellae bacterium]|nr:glycogen/starch synthase [Kiritimatiellia bacterium]
MKVAFATSEAVPFASTGGLGEVAHALPAALKTDGVDVIRVMPMYRQVLEGGYELRDTQWRLRIPVGFRVYIAEIWEAHQEPVPTYFVRRDEYFDRRALYSLSERDYTDNLERFVFFQKSVVALLDTMGWSADIVHCNDWTSGMIPLYLRHGISGTGRAGRERTVFTIHNLAYQGIFPGAEFPTTNLPFSCFTMQGMEFFGNMNCMKAGLTS